MKKNKTSENRINGACGCAKGKVRENNEDNFYFAGEYLESENDGMKNAIKRSLKNDPEKIPGVFAAVFDGMGGAQYGEIAAYEAAVCTDAFLTHVKESGSCDGTPMLRNLCDYINKEVFKAGEEKGIQKMGTTMAALYFHGSSVWSCNVGDSRCYRLRDGVLELLSEDHVEEMYSIDRINNKKKPGLVQYMGMDPSEIRLEPTINCRNLKNGDSYLICSDGLTDMVAESDIANIIRETDDAGDAANYLIDLALMNGGKDNVTVIVCKC